MPRVCHFEIHVADPEKAIAFYQSTFGWQFTRWEGPMEYYLITTGPETEPGINGGLMRRQGDGPMPGQGVNAYVCTVTVASVDATVAAITAAGGAVVVPKMAIPGVGWLAYATDTQGNIFGVMHNDPQAG